MVEQGAAPGREEGKPLDPCEIVPSTTWGVVMWMVVQLGCWVGQSDAVSWDTASGFGLTGGSTLNPCCREPVSGTELLAGPFSLGA